MVQTVYFSVLVMNNFTHRTKTLMGVEIKEKRWQREDIIQAWLLGKQGLSPPSFLEV